MSSLQIPNEFRDYLFEQTEKKESENWSQKVIGKDLKQLARKDLTAPQYYLEEEDIDVFQEEFTHLVNTLKNYYNDQTA